MSQEGSADPPPVTLRGLGHGNSYGDKIIVEDASYPPSLSLPILLIILRGAGVNNPCIRQLECVLRQALRQSQNVGIEPSIALRAPSQAQRSRYTYLNDKINALAQRNEYIYHVDFDHRDESRRTV